MIAEGLVTSVDAEGRINLAPMGPIVFGDFESLLLRPFQPSATFSNLSQTRHGVFHVVDQVDVIVRIVLGTLTTLPEMEPAHVVPGHVLKDCCRWFEFQVESVDATEARSQMAARIVHRGERRPFFGFNRARHALLEAAIIATRTHLMEWPDISSAFQFLEPAVKKTGGQTELDLFQLLYNFVQKRKNPDV